ncbi:hypothetical protein ONZ45_g9472 [Pleurotus djamor]|nr:hypothetical protein ONZ45_g9472 [Pleurotus djamor]
MSNDGGGKGRSAEEVADFQLMSWSLEDVRRAIPPHCFERDLRKGLSYLARDLVMASAAGFLVFQSERISNYFATSPTGPSQNTAAAVYWLCWATYWWFQSLIFLGIFVIGHECGHGAFSKYQTVNDVIGYIVHSCLWIPYFSWKITHHGHHMGHGSMERDEVFVPSTRSELGIPFAATRSQLGEILGESPIYTLFMLIRQQCLGFPAYFLLNISGQKRYPKWTNHLNPYAAFFAPSQRTSIILSDLGLVFMIIVTWTCCSVFGGMNFLKYYGVPWTGMMHWYNGKEATRHLRAFIGEQYYSHDGPTFKSLWDVYNQCQFVEDTGDVVFYKDKHGCATNMSPSGAELIIPQMTIQNNVEVCSLVIFYHDFLLTFGLDVERFWKRPKLSLVTLLFFLNRYGLLLAYIPTLAILTLWGQIMMSPSNEPGTQEKLCINVLNQLQGVQFAGMWVGLLILDMAVFSLTLRKTLALLRECPSSGSLWSGMMRDGAVYFGSSVLSITNLTNILMLLLAPPALKTLLADSINILAATMISRLMLNLRDTSIMKLKGSTTVLVLSGPIQFAAATTTDISLSPDSPKVSGQPFNAEYPPTIV